MTVDLSSVIKSSRVIFQVCTGVQDADMRTAVKFDVTESHAAERFVRIWANLRTAERETGTEIPERVTFFQLYQGRDTGAAKDFRALEQQQK